MPFIGLRDRRHITFVKLPMKCGLNKYLREDLQYLIFAYTYRGLMIGIVIVTHSQLGQALIEAAEFILGSRLESVAAVSINLKENPEKLRNKIVKGIKSVTRDHGVLILTDMFGGTPSNLSYSFLEEGKVEVLSGVNLPILIKAIGLQKQADLEKVAKMTEEFGRKSISLASGILQGKKRG